MKQPGNGIGQSVPAGFYTTADAARLIRRSPDTLARWRKGKSPVFKPSKSMKVGKTKVWLYSEDDIEKMKDIARSQKPGPKVKQVA